MLFKNVIAAATLATVLIGTSLPSYAASVIPLPEDAVAVGFGGQPAGPFTYTGGASKQTLDGAVNAAAPFNGSFVFDNTTDVTGDNSFSYLTQTGDTALSASFFVTQQLLGNLTSINLFFNSLPIAGSLNAYLYDATNNQQLNLLVSDNIATYAGINSGDFKDLLVANTTYSIQWVYTGTGVAGFNNAVLQIEAVPEPSEILGLISFGLVVYGGALQKKRSLKRAA